MGEVSYSEQHEVISVVLSAIMSIKAVQGCTKEAECVVTLGLSGCNRPNTTRDLNRVGDWLEELLEKMYGKKAFLDMVQRKDRAIPELGLMSNGPRFAPSRER